ncbi:MAG: hypothetical protein ACLFSB_13630 [Chitinispirillaceae bacterium]
MNSFLYTILYMILLLSCTTTAQISLESLSDIRGRKSGQTVASFLTLPASASLLAQNMVATTGTLEASDIYWAPANSAFFKRHTFGFSHLEWLMGLRKEFAGAAFPLLDIGTIGIYSQVFTLGNFNHARTIDENRSDPQAVEYTVGGSFARQFIPGILSAGVQLSFLESRLDELTARALSADLDLVYKPHRFCTSRLYAKHIGTPMTYSDNHEPLPFSLGIAGTFSPVPPSDTIPPDFITWALSAGMRKQVDEPLTLAGGATMGIGSHLKLRSGYEYRYGSHANMEGLSAGISLDYKGYGVDAGWKYQSEIFGPVWAVSVRYATEELTPKNAHDYYLIANKHFTKKRYRMAIRYAKKALAVNPNFWKAHQLINETISILRRNKGIEIGLIYSGNILGHFVPEIEGEHKVGGLSRVATVIGNLKKDYPLSITLETGNLITAETDPIKTGVADIYFQEVGFDAHIVGHQELGYGLTGYGEATDGAGATFVCSNCRFADSENLVRSDIVSAGKYRIAVLSLIADQKNTRLHHGFAALKQQLSLPAVKSCDLRIVVLHADWAEITSYLGEFQNVDFAICGSLEQKFDAPMKIGNAVVLSAGAFGRYVGLLRLRFNSDKKLLGFENSLIPVTSDIKPHERVEKEVQRLVSQTQLRNQGISHIISQDSDTTGLLPFISTRHGRPQVFLKVLSKHADFPMTTDGLSYTKPVTSFSAGKIACVSEMQNDSSVVIMDITGANKKKLSLHGVTDISFGPGGDYLYVASRSDTAAFLHRFFNDGTGKTLLFTWPNSVITDITFSSRGLMGFTGRRDDRFHIFITDTSSWNPVQVSDGRADHIKPSFSPHGRYLSWLSDRYNFGGRKDLWIHDLHAGKTVPVTRRTALSSYCWIDNSRIVYATGETMQALHTVDIFKRRSAALISRKSDKRYQEHSPRLFETGEGTRIVYVREYPDGKRQVHWVKPDGSEDQRLISSNGSEWIR